MPADITRSRDFYFAYHPQWDEATSQPAAAPASAADSPLSRQMAELNISADEINVNDAELENRHVSNNTESVSAFFAALLADSTLTAEQRQALARRVRGCYPGQPASKLSLHLPPSRLIHRLSPIKIIWPQLPVSMPVIMPAPNGISLSLPKVSARGWQRPRNTC